MFQLNQAMDQTTILIRSMEMYISGRLIKLYLRECLFDRLINLRTIKKSAAIKPMMTAPSHTKSSGASSPKVEFVISAYKRNRYPRIMKIENAKKA